MLVLLNLLCVTSSLDSIPKVTRPYDLLYCLLSNVVKACVKCLSGGWGGGEIQTIISNFVSLVLCLWWGEKSTVDYQGCGSEDQEVFRNLLFLNSAGLAGPNSRYKFTVWLDYFCWEGGLCGLQRSACGPLFCPSTLGMWEVGDLRKIPETGIFQPDCFSHLQKGESSLGRRSAAQGGKLDRLN